MNLPGASSTGQPVPPTAETIGGQDSNGNTYSAKVCDASAPIIRPTGSSDNLEVIPGLSGKKIYVCGLYLAVDTAAGLGFFASGDHCSTSVSPVTGTTKLPPNGGYALGLSSFAVPFGGAAGTSLCIATDGPALIGGWIAFTQQ